MQFQKSFRVFEQHLMGFIVMPPGMHKNHKHPQKQLLDCCSFVSKRALDACSLSHAVNVEFIIYGIFSKNQPLTQIENAMFLLKQIHIHKRLQNRHNNNMLRTM